MRVPCCLAWRFFRAGICHLDLSNAEALLLCWSGRATCRCPRLPWASCSEACAVCDRPRLIREPEPCLHGRHWLLLSAHPAIRAQTIPTPDHDSNLSRPRMIAGPGRVLGRFTSRLSASFLARTSLSQARSCPLRCASTRTSRQVPGWHSPRPGWKDFPL